MTQKPDGGPAYPTTIDACDGKTLRDWFAGQALAGLINAGKLESVASSANVDLDKLTAQVAYGFADAMVKERDVK